MSVSSFDQIPETAWRWHQEGTRAAIATVIATWGSAPRPVGSQLAISADAGMVGSVSGGCVEGAVVAEALDAIADGNPRILDFGVSDVEAFAVGLGCGGQIKVMVEPIGDAGLPVAMLERVVTAKERREPIGIATDTTTWTRQIVGPQDYPDRFTADQSGQEDTQFITLFNPPLRMIVIGAVHIAQPLMAMARLAGYDAVLIDPREAFASQQRFPDDRILHDWPDDAMRVEGLDARTAVVTLTHDPKLDDPAIAAALNAPVFYLGCLGSTRTHAKRVARLEARGFSTAHINRIDAPVGSDIGAKSPAEIAISIMAELTERLRRPQTRR